MLHFFGTSTNPRKISGLVIQCSKLKFFTVWMQGWPVKVELIRKTENNFDQLLIRFCTYQWSVSDYMGCKDKATYYKPKDNYGTLK